MRCFGCCTQSPPDVQEAELAQPSNGPAPKEAQQEPGAAEGQAHQASVKMVTFAVPTPDSPDSPAAEQAPPQPSSPCGPDGGSEAEAALARAAAAAAVLAEQPSAGGAAAAEQPSAAAAARSEPSTASQHSQAGAVLRALFGRVSSRLSSLSRSSLSRTHDKGAAEAGQPGGAGPGMSHHSEDESSAEESEGEASEQWSDGGDIVDEEATVGSHSGRVLAPITRTTKLQVGVIEGTTFLNQYVVVDTLGRGTYGNVKLCLNTLDDTLYAVKVVNKKLLRRKAQSGRTFGHDPVEDLKREVEVMRALNHPNLIQLREVIEDRQGGKVLMVMEYASGGALVGQNQLTRAHHMPEAMAQYYFRQIVAGLAHLHANRVVHGDLKPENVLLSGDCTLKIGDFGQSQFFEKKDSMKRTLGTPAFLPPEVCAGGVYHGRAADMWALGISLFLFIYGELPFQANSVADLYDAIAAGHVAYPGWVEPSPHLSDLMHRLLDPDPDARATAAEALQHPWITGSEWKHYLPDLSPDPRTRDAAGGGGGGGNAGGDGKAVAQRQQAERQQAEDFAALVFPEMQGSDGLRTALTMDLGLVDALMTTNRGRHALRVRDASRLRTLAASAGSSRSLLRAGGTAADSRRGDPAFRSAFSFSSSFGGGGGGGSSRGSGRGAALRKTVSSASSGAVSACASPSREASRAGSSPPPPAGHSSRAAGSDAGPALPLPPPGRQFSLEGPFASISAFDPAPPPPAAPANGTTPAGDAAALLPPGLAAPKESSSEELIASVQSAPVGAATVALQRVFKAAKTMKRQRERQQQQLGRVAEGEEQQPEEQQEGVQQAQQARGAQAAGGGRGSGDDLAVSLSVAEWQTAEAFARMVELMQEHAAAQQAQAEEEEAEQQQLLGADEAAGVAEDSAAAAQPGGGPATEDGGKGAPPGALSAAGPLPPAPAAHVSMAPALSRITECEEPDLMFAMSPAPSGQPPAAAAAAPGQRDSAAAAAAAGPRLETLAEGGDSTPPLPPTSPPAAVPAAPAAAAEPAAAAAAVAAAELAEGPAPGAAPAATSFTDLRTSPFGAGSPFDLPSFTSPPFAAPGGPLAAAGVQPASQGAAGPEAAQPAPGAAEPPGSTPAASGGAASAEEQQPTASSSGSGAARQGQVTQLRDAATGNFFAGKLAPRPPLPPKKGRGPGEKKKDLVTIQPGLDFTRTLTGLDDTMRSLPDDFPPIQTITFVAGEVVAAYKSGHTPLCLYIESGTMEVHYQANLPVPLSCMAALASGLVPQAGAPDVGLLLEMDDTVDSVAYGSHLVDIASIIADGSRSLPVSTGSSELESPQLERAHTLMRTVRAATDRAEQLLRNATAGGSIDELLVSERGPNQFLGALTMLDPDFMGGRWKTALVARTDVQAVIMTKKGLEMFLLENPLAQIHLRAAMARSRGEITRLEALEKLASAREHREARRRQVAEEAAAAKMAAQASQRRRPGAAVAGVVRSAASVSADTAGHVVEHVAEGLGDVLGGVASLDVFGLVSRLRAALTVPE